jgi:hypothetical protein
MFFFGHFTFFRKNTRSRFQHLEKTPLSSEDSSDPGSGFDGKESVSRISENGQDDLVFV